MPKKFFTYLLALMGAVMTSISAKADVPFAAKLPGYDIRAITMADGLPHNFIDYMVRDSQGFMWYALAGGGLVRYDGYSFERFDPILPDRSLSGYFIGCIQEDPWGRMWVATDQGLSVIDIEKMISLPVGDFGIDGPLAELAIKDLAFDAKGRLWVTGETAIWMIPFDADGAPQTPLMLEFPECVFNSVALRDIYHDGTMAGIVAGTLCVMTPTTDQEITCTPTQCTVDPHVTMYDLLVKDNKVWIATDTGLYCWDMSANKTRLYTFSESDPGSISQNFITCLKLNTKGNLLISTLRGLNEYDEENDRFVRFDLTQYNPSPSLSSNFINCLLPEEDNLWIGTEGAGVLLLTPSRALISYHNFGDDRASSKPVNAILEDNQHTVWIGLIEGGLAYKPKNSPSFKILTTANSPLPHNSVSALAVDSEDGLWVGTWGEGVIVLDHNNPSKEKYRLELDPGNGNMRMYIGALQYDALNHGMWIGTSIGLFFYDMETKHLIEPFPNAYENVKGAIGAAIDSKKHLWLGSYNGLYDINLGSRSGDQWEYRLLENKLDQPDSNAKERISSVLVTPEGTLWVGSSVNGLYQRQIVDGQEEFINYNIDNGLPHNSVRGVLQDFNGKIWVATYNGLAIYEPDDSIWELVKAADQSTQFYWNAYAKTSDGHLLFGSSEGLVDIDSRSLPTPSDDFTVHFTRYQIDGSSGMPSPLKTLGGKASEVSFSESARTITIEFSALDYVQDPASSYYYRLKGFDANWKRLPKDRHDVTYTNLSPGDYELEVGYGRNLTNSVRHASVLPLNVSPLYYHTWWFRCLIALLIMALAYLLYRYKMASMKQQKEELEVAVTERTREINEQKMALEKRTIQVQELTVDRLSFFTNITHEFRTPITLILGPLNQAIQLNDNPKVAKQLQYIGRNANYLLSLVNQLMDFRKIESGKIELARRPGSFPHFLRDTIEGFEPLANDRNIKLVTIMSVPEENICFDKEAMRKLLHNFISNALKYTPDGGEITVRAALLPEWCNLAGGVRKLYLSVSDTGDGIDPADIDKIFNRFYQGKGNIKYPNIASSSGIGLYLCKNIVEAYGGELKAKNNRGAGCTFRVLLPLLSEDVAEQVQEAMPLMVAPTIEPAAASTKVTVLVVEDNKDMRDYIGDILSENYNVIKAENAAEGLRLLQSENIDFIISDLMMPGMDGMEFSKKVKENLAISHIPIIMLTAKSSDMTRRESYITGVDDFISKPFNPKVLTARIDNILQNKKRYQRQFAISYEVDKVEMPEDSRDKKFLAQVMDVVKNNYKNSYFEVGDFAEALGVSRSFLNKKLQSLIGQSASQLMKSYRMKLAHELLLKNRETRQYTIQEIAYDVGFNDSKYFTKCFSKEFNVTPSAFMSTDSN